MKITRMCAAVAPLAGVLVFVVGWSASVRLADTPSYILPSPEDVVTAIIVDWGILQPALFITARTTLWALCLALFGGVSLAVILSQSKWIEDFFSPIIVTLQVTPIVAIAPLVLIYAPSAQLAQVGCACLVAFFPIMLNTLHGLKSADRDHIDLVRLYTGSRWQMLLWLQVPSAMPSFFAGLKIGSGLALVGAVVAEFAAGAAGGNAGLAFRLLEAQFSLKTPRLFAALVLLAFLGTVIFFVVSILDRIVLRHWYASRATQKSAT